jgi:microcystin-dependent protein
MLVTNLTSSDIYFGPLHLEAGMGSTLTVDDTSATSLYLLSDSVADALNNAYAAAKISVSGQAEPFPRPTGTPQLLHGLGDPDGLVYAAQGSVYMRQDGYTSNGGGLYVKMSGVTSSKDWSSLAVASGATAMLPPGLIIPYGGGTAPGGWLLCDGSAVSRSTYSLLFGAIGTAFGSGDGSSTFNVPNLKGNVPAGFDSAETEFNALGKTGGEKTHTLSTGEMPVHAHGISDPGHVHGISDPGHGHVLQVNTTGGGGGNGTPSNASDQTTNSGTIEASATGVSVQSHTTSISVNNQGGGGAHNNLQPYLTVNYLIKT